MTRIQKAICIIMSVGFMAVLMTIPDLKWIGKNLYRQLPFYCFLERNDNQIFYETDQWISELIIEGNARRLSEQVMSEAVQIVEQTEPVKVKEIQPKPILDLSMEYLGNMDYLLGNFFIVDEKTDAGAVNLDAAKFLETDLTIEKDDSIPQILIYHSHSQEDFSDSRPGKEEDTIVGVGAYLTDLLEKDYGYQVIHVKEKFDLQEGYLNRSSAYDYSGSYVQNILDENPSIEVVIDLHRDGVAENRHLVTEINGKNTAQIMFYNGLSYTNSYGQVDYLPNPYIQDNLAFSFQLEYQAALYYPKLYRGIYLAGLRYNLHLKPRALLLEAGAQTNTVQEVKNAMEPFADILNRVLEKR